MQRYKSPQKAQEYAESLGKQVLEQDPKARHSSPYQVTMCHQLQITFELHVCGNY